MEELFRRWKTLVVTVGLILAALPAAGQDARTCARWVRADVVALDQPWSWNRYGALEPQGMMYALRRDVVSLDDADGLPPSDKPLVAGNVRLRTDKRPRPLVLRVNEGDCLEIQFQNLLDANSFDDEAPHTRAASVHVVGLQPFTIDDDGSNVGTNVSSVVDPGGSAVYRLYAEREGTYLLHSMGAVAGGEGDGGSISAGLFGAVNVEPAGSVWYRSQVTREDLAAASTFEKGYPRIDYEALYPSGTYAGQPVFAMLSGGEIVYSDLTAVIAYGANPGSTKVYPDRNEPFREFTIIFHDEIGAVQAFPHFYDKQLAFTLHGAREGFAINYGTGGAGAEILAN
ncbi:MAG TPA: copper oxidase, partial [Thermoanaerobaculia bacterium]|nr:copper oxidase [Thermoanaerobaculia bacterium]